VTVVIHEVVTEVVLGAEPAQASAGAGTGPAAGAPGDETVELIVRRATERVLETLRREWDQ
jgi:hypothetical protein